VTSPADVAVIGGGILGLATARALVLQNPDVRVTVLEAEDELARHQTGRSSGVVHRGLYYAPGSRKAQMCVQGGAALLAYCDERQIPYRLCGKLVVATSSRELPRLEELHRRGVANGVPGLAVVERDRLRELEPHAAGVRGLHSPATAIVDFAVVARSYADDIVRGGGEVRTGSEVRALVRRGRSVLLSTTSGDVEARQVVACAGVNADRLATLTGGARDPSIVPFRGSYWLLRPEARRLVNGLVYPVPDPSFPFLGVHFTVRLDGSVLLGPNAVLAFARDGYRRWQLRPHDLWDAVSAPGFRKLARRHWRSGAAEVARDWSQRLLVREARRLVPELKTGDVVRGPAGIRAQALAPDGSLVDDFVFDGDDRVVHVRNAPSPGATASLAIGDEIASRVVRAWDLGG
jgi:(S)-2-hydroxyglutarate dehydrogenase